MCAGTNFLKIQLNSYWNGIFSFGACFNHSCQPNAMRYIWSDGWSAVICLTNIRAGSEVCVSYGYTEKSSWHRRLGLLYRYGFRCRCERCCAGAPMPASVSQLYSQNTEKKGPAALIFETFYGRDGSREVLNACFPTKPSARQQLGRVLGEARCQFAKHGQAPVGSASAVAKAAVAACANSGHDTRWSASEFAWSNEFVSVPRAPWVESAFKDAVVPDSKQLHQHSQGTH